jgi:phosphotransferase system HPr (HPr) family protein
MSGRFAGTGPAQPTPEDPAAQPPLSAALQPSLHAMNGEPLRCKVTITNPQGFHMRPMSAFVQLAAKFQSTVHVLKSDGQRIDGKSMLGLLGLAAEQGTELTLEVEGPDEQTALDALAELMARPHPDDET